jgi:hypothetical protein
MNHLASLLSPLNALLHGQRKPGDASGPGISLRTPGLITWAVILGLIYGFFVGWFALFGDRPDAWKHVLAVMVKIPALFFFTLIVTFPSLYVFSALFGSRIGFRATLQVLCATIAVNLAVAASMGPILGFFTLSTTSYGFMVLLNVVLMGLAGLVSVGYLLRALRRARLDSTLPQIEPPAQPAEPEPSSPPFQDPAPSVHPLHRVAEERRRAAAMQPIASEPIPPIFLIWIFTYGIVGAQMGWILRPFIGAPGQPFELFRDRSGSVVQGIFNALRSMF